MAEKRREEKILHHINRSHEPSTIICKSGELLCPPLVLRSCILVWSIPSTSLFISFQLRLPSSSSLVLFIYSLTPPSFSSLSLYFLYVYSSPFILTLAVSHHHPFMQWDPKQCEEISLCPQEFSDILNHYFDSHEDLSGLCQLCSSNRKVISCNIKLLLVYWCLHACCWLDKCHTSRYMQTVHIYFWDSSILIICVSVG